MPLKIFTTLVVPRNTCHELYNCCDCGADDSDNNWCGCFACFSRKTCDAYKAGKPCENEA